MGLRTEGFELTQDERKFLLMELTDTWHKRVIDTWIQKGRSKEAFALGVKKLSTPIQGLDGGDFETKAKIDVTDTRQYELDMTWIPGPSRVRRPDPPPPSFPMRSSPTAEPANLTIEERHGLAYLKDVMESMEKQSPGVTEALTMLAHLALAQATLTHEKRGGAEFYSYAARAYARERRPSVFSSSKEEPETHAMAEIASALTKTEAFGLWLSIYRLHLSEDVAD